MGGVPGLIFGYLEDLFTSQRAVETGKCVQSTISRLMIIRSPGNNRRTSISLLELDLEAPNNELLTIYGAFPSRCVIIGLLFVDN